MPESNEFKKCKNNSTFLKFLLVMKRFQLLASSFHNLKLNLSHTDFHTMSYIIQSAETNPHGVIIGDLAKQFMISPPAVSRAVSSLEKRGYVMRTTDLNNRRSVAVTPTEKGISAMNEDKRFFEKIAVKISQEIEDEKLDQLETLLKQLYKTVYDAIEEEKNNL